MLLGTTILPVREVRAQGLSVSVTASPATICNGESSLLTANASGGSGSYTYSWSNGQTTGSFTDYPTVTAVYSVTVSDGSNTVTDNATVTVNVNTDCCVSGLGLTIWEEPTASALLAALSSSTVNTNNIILITGTFIVDVDLGFFNCPNIRANPNAVIQLNSGVRLTVDNSVISAACPTMWTGIVAPNNNDEVEIVASEIRDAQVAINSSNGGIVDLKGAQFFNNRVHVRLSNGNYPYPNSRIEGCTLTCTQTGGVSDMLNPFLGGITTRAIDLSMVNDFQIGTEVGPQTNFISVFRDEGVFSDRTNDLVVVNTDFFGGLVANPWNALMAGSCGIRALGALGADHFLRVGGTDTYSKCRFYTNRLRTGIEALTLSYVLIQGNEMQSMPTRFIDIQNHRFEARIIDNLIDVGAFPIRVLNPFGETITLIEDNKITTGNGRAIDVQNTSIDPTVQVRISGNDIGGRPFGIRLTNLDRTYVNNNMMTVPAAFGQATMTGIRLSGCTNCRIVENSVRDLNTSWRTNYLGIEVRDASNSSTLCSNEVENLHAGIVYIGENPNKIITNTMTDCYYGLAISNNGIPGPQGNCNPAVPAHPGTHTGDPFGNVFSGSLDSDLWSQNGSYGDESPIADNSPLSSDHDNSGGNAIVQIPETSASIPSCPGNPFGFRLAEGGESALEQELLPDFDYLSARNQDLRAEHTRNPSRLTEHILWLNDFYVSRLALQDGLTPAAISGFTPASGPVNAAYATLLLEEVYLGRQPALSATGSGLLFAANWGNSELDSLYKFVYRTGIDIFTNGKETVTETVIQRLKSVARLCPNDYGSVVALAGNLTSVLTGETIESDGCPEEFLPSQRLGKGLPDVLQVHVFPNPADKQVEFRLNTKLNEPGRMKLIIHDLAGRLLTEQDFATDENPVLSVQNWNQGLYLYILQTASGEVARGKFSVIH